MPEASYGEPMSVTLRSDKTFPIDSWLELYHAAEYNNWWTERNARAALAYAFLVITAWDDDAAVGTATVWSDGVNFAWLDDVVVHPDRRNEGIGSLLVTGALTRIRAAGIDGVQLFPIPGRESFFARFGFVVQSGATVMDLQ